MATKFKVMRNPMNCLIPKTSCFNELGYILSLIFIVMLAPQGLLALEDHKTLSYDEEPTISCITHVNISLDQAGTATIVPSMLLSGPPPPSWVGYSVDIMGPLTDMVTCAELGQTLMVAVTDPTGNICMSEITVEDKLGPLMTCSSDFIYCNEDPFSIDFLQYLSVLSDNCDPNPDVYFVPNYDSVLTNSCDPTVIGFVVVDYFGTDASGNQSTTQCTINVNRIPIPSVVFPNDTTLYCPDSNIDPEFTGAPSFNGTPVDHSCGLFVSYVDNPPVQMCCGSYKIYRNWSVMDWCQNPAPPTNAIQVIYVRDTVPPVVTCPGNVVHNADGQNCTFNYTIPTLPATDVCCPNGISAATVTFSANVPPGLYTSGDVVNLPLGVTTVTYEVSDGCNNTASCVYTVTVEDNIPPVPFCQARTFAVDNTGCVFVDVNALGFNDTDNCAIVSREFRRMTDACGTPDNLVFGSELKFCCADIGSNVMVEYRVFDSNGNYNTCMFPVTIVDNIAPVFTNASCSTGNAGVIDLGCQQFPPTENMAITEIGGATDNCEVTSMGAVGGTITGDCMKSQTFVITASDASGNTTSCEVTYTWRDGSISPILSCAPNMSVSCSADVVANTGAIVLDSNCSVGATVVAGAPVAGSNNSSCGQANGDTYFITYVVTDECGNDWPCTQMFTITNTMLSITNCPASIIVACSSDAVADIPAVNYITGCGLGAEVTAGAPVSGANNSACGESDGDIYTITYTVTDDCGNTATCVQQFTLDSEPPTIVCPPDVTVECLDEVIADEASVTTTAGCNLTGTLTSSAPMGMSTNSIPGDCNGDRYRIEYTYIDACGNSAMCTQVFTLQNDGPEITACPADLTINCLTDLVIDLTGVSYTTSCSLNGYVAAVDTIAGANNSACGESDGDTYTVVYQVSDDCGRVTTCNQIFTIDSDPPMLNCPADLTVSCFDDVIGDPTAVTFVTGCSIGGNPAVAGTPQPDPNNSACGESDGDIYTIEYTVTDVCGNVGTCTQTFTIDSDPPSIVCPADVTVSCFTDIEDDVANVVIMTGCSMTGNVVAGIPVGVNGNSASGTCDGDIYTITYTGTDACGETATCTQTFTIENNGPTITACAADVTVSCFSDINISNASVTYSTECGLGGTVTNGGLISDGGNSNNGSCDGDVYTVVFTVTDDCGRTANCTQTFTIDNDGPTIVCPIDMTVSCESDIAEGIPTTATDCGLGSTVTTAGPTLVSGTAGEDGAVYEIAYTVTDDCGRASSCTQTWTLDNTGFTITCPADLTVSCESDIAEGTATASSACGTNVQVTSVGPTYITGSGNGMAECDGAMYEIVYTATDSEGNSVSCTQTFTLDNNGPTIVAPADMTVNCDTDIIEGTPTTSTDCGFGFTVSTVGPTLVSGTAGEDGAVYEIVYTITDDCGNTASDTQTWTLDNVGLMITCPADLTVSCASDVVEGTASASSTCGTTPTITTNGPNLVSGTDNCDGAVYEIVYTATDSDGNTASCTQTFTLDNNGPTIVCPPDMTVGCDTDIVVGTPTVTTDCGLTPTVTTVGPTLVSGTAGQDGAVYEIEYTVTDDCNRMASCIQTWTLDDPGLQITCPADMTVACEADIVEGIPTVSTSCGANTNVTAVGPTLISGTANCDGAVYNYVYTVTDLDNGNSVSCTQTWTLSNAAPTITCPADQTVSCTSAISYSIADAIITSSCGLGTTVTASATPIPDPNNSACGESDGDSYSVTYTVTDDCGRSASCTQVFTIDPPALTFSFCPPDVTVTDSDDSGTEFVTLLPAVVTFSCTNVTISNDYNNNGADASDNYPVGQTTVTFTATDLCGNTVTCSTVITVEEDLCVDQEPPMLVCTKGRYIIQDNGEVTVNANDPGMVLMATDDCTDSIDLVIAFDVNFTEFSQTFDCDDAGVEYAITLYVMDQAGNIDSCTNAAIGVIDLNGFCPSPQPLVQVAGTIESEKYEPVEAATVFISTPQMLPRETNSDGSFMWEYVSVNSAYTFTPKKDINHLEGVSTLDIIGIQKHLLNIEVLPSPYRMIAADINKSNSISAIDIIELRKLLLGIYTEFPDNDSWRFVDASYIFINPFDPFYMSFPESITYSPVTNAEMSTDFMGVKIGDVNASFVAQANQDVLEDRGADVTMQLSYPELKKDELSNIQVRLAKDQLIEGMQFELVLPQTLELTKLKSGSLILDESNYHIIDGQNLRFVWSAANALELDADDVLFTIEALALESSDLNKADFNTDSHLNAEVYGPNGMLADLNLDIVEQSVNIEHFSYELFQNEPNPFKGQTIIRFSLAKDTEAELNIFDATGKLVYTENGSYIKGINEIKIDLNKISDSKLFIYSISTDEFFATRKMIQSN